MPSKLLPQSLDNRYEGHRLALWLFGIVVFLRIAQSLAVIFNGYDTAVQADGFPLDELRVQYIKSRAPVFSQWPDAKRIFLPGGLVPKAGDIFVQADLARTMRELVRAERLGSKSVRNGRHDGLMAARD